MAILCVAQGLRKERNWYWITRVHGSKTFTLRPVCTANLSSVVWSREEIANIFVFCSTLTVECTQLLQSGSPQTRFTETYIACSIHQNPKLDWSDSFAGLMAIYKLPDNPPDSDLVTRSRLAVMLFLNLLIALNGDSICTGWLKHEAMLGRTKNWLMKHQLAPKWLAILHWTTDSCYAIPYRSQKFTTDGKNLDIAQQSFSQSCFSATVSRVSLTSFQRRPPGSDAVLNL
jgi:hypothetical protein